MVVEDGQDGARELGAWIRTLRESSGKPVSDLAMEAGVSQRELERWERGTHSSQALAFFRLLDALGVDVDQPVNLRAPLRHELRVLGDRIEAANAQLQEAIRELGQDVQLDLRLLQRSVTTLVEKAERDLVVERERAPARDAPSKPGDVHG